LCVRKLAQRGRKPLMHGEKCGFTECGFVAVRDDALVDSARVKSVSNRGMLRLELRVARGIGNSDNPTSVPKPQRTKTSFLCLVFFTTSYYYYTSV
jgi:hypothetical protein